MKDMFPRPTFEEGEKWLQFLKRNSADIAHLCVVIATAAIVLWVAWSMLFASPAPEPATVPESVKGAEAAARQQPPWWWDALLNAVKALTPIALPFISNYARKKLKNDDDE